MRDEDKAQVREMMRALWPDEENPPYGVGSVFVHEREDGTLGGFVAFGERKWVDGCDTSPVCHVEGWWVAPELRRQGVGGALLRAVEAWAREKGYAELSSDTEVTNELSQRAHAALGFEVLDRIQYFRKKL